jgi:hypothetical protein
MGTWGPGIFSDDLACDLRDRYRDLLGDGLSGEEATDQLLAEWQTELADPDVVPVFWLALAATQWKVGRLEDRVKAEALRIISTGADLSRWEGSGPAFLKKRQVALQKLCRQIESPQPPPRRIPKRFVNSCDWEVGEVLAFRLLSGRFTLFRIVFLHSDYGGTRPVCEFLDWVGDDIPSPEAVGELKVRPFIPSHASPDELPILIIGRANARELPVARITRLGIRTRPQYEYSERGPHPWTLWRWIDRSLLSLYGFV